MDQGLELSPGELVEKFPELEAIGWKKNFLGMLLANGLVDGTRDRSNKISEINVQSLQSLLDHRNSIIDLQKVSLNGRKTKSTILTV